MRTATIPRDLIAGSEYQESIGCMKRPELEWPCKRTFGQAPMEEMQKNMVAVACSTSASEKGNQHEEDDPF
jgi:hypothetical protein